MKIGDIEFQAVGNIFNRHENLLIGRWDDGFYLVVPGIAIAIEDASIMPSVAEEFQRRREAIEKEEQDASE